MASNSRLSFKFSFDRRYNFSVILFVILLGASVLTYFGVEIVKDRQAAQMVQEKTPKLQMEMWQKDLQAFHAKNGRYPKTLKELDFQIWNAGDADKPSHLKNGDKVYLLDNFLYIYNGEAQVCSLWAIPLGEYKKDSNTVFLLLQPKSSQTWKGATFNTADIEQVPNAAVPTPMQMARLGMSRQASEEATQQQQPKKTFFKSFGKQ